MDSVGLIRSSLRSRTKLEGGRGVTVVTVLFGNEFDFEGLQFCFLSIRSERALCQKGRSSWAERSIRLHMTSSISGRTVQVLGLSLRNDRVAGGYLNDTGSTLVVGGALGNLMPQLGGLVRACW